MLSISKSFSHQQVVQSVPNIWWLITGVALYIGAHLSYGIDLLGWFFCVPFLLFLRKASRKKSLLWFMLVLFIAWTLTTAKIITPPIPFGLVFLFSLPIALIQLPGYLVWRFSTRSQWSSLLFASVMTIMEWLQYSFTPFASWGVAAYTQSNHLEIMQSLSLFGMPGLSFLIYWINATIAEKLLNEKEEHTLIQTLLPFSILFLLLIYGSLRIGNYSSHGVDTLHVAAVGTDSEYSGLPLPDESQNAPLKARLLRRTRQAAQNGASMIVWNEAAAVIMPSGEHSWIDTLSKIAKENKISLIAAYVVPVSTEPFEFKNQYVFLGNDGNIRQYYQKHEPVPGEPSVKGKEALKVEDIGGVLVGGAICYDYDYPYLARQYGDLKADIVVVPSSDWRGIDPIHTQMAAFRAVEQGHSIIRSTRFGLSAAINPTGKMIAQMSSFDNNDKIMHSWLPVKRHPTLYSILGDWVVGLAFTFVLFQVFINLKKSPKH
ncbi:MAG: apolipoprotein N-acyltransferase [Saprospiraceae bacterium]|nr:apolipoprotein N-acyltransferase [Saprospiraceae bacterium]